MERSAAPNAPPRGSARPLADHAPAHPSDRRGARRGRVSRFISSFGRGRGCLDSFRAQTHQKLRSLGKEALHFYHAGKVAGSQTAPPTWQARSRGMVTTMQGSPSCLPAQLRTWRWHTSVVIHTIQSERSPPKVAAEAQPARLGVGVGGDL